MSHFVEYEDRGPIALIKMDDGAVNAVSPQLIQEVNRALDQAEEKNQVVVLQGREGKFSAGFDLKIMSKGGLDMANLVNDGARLALRMAQFKTPIVAACSGHSIAMGALLLLSTDYRVAVEGKAKIGLNEVAIGLPLAYFGIELAKARLNSQYLARAVNLGELFNPQDALQVGYVDEVVDEGQLLEVALQRAEQFSKLDMKAHYITKKRLFETVYENIEKGIEVEFKAFFESTESE